MTKQRCCSGGWIVGLVLALVALLGAPSFAQTAKTAGVYRLSMEAPYQVTQFAPAEIVVTVKDSQGQPVNGVPVEFQIEPGWEKNITLSAQRPVTEKNGEARSTFKADMSGIVHITAHVGDTATTAHIAVSCCGSTIGGHK